MVGIYIGIACMAVVIVAVFVDNLPANSEDKKANVSEEVYVEMYVEVYNM